MTDQPQPQQPAGDDLDWDRSEHGRMADHATNDNAVPTIPWTPDDA